MESPPPPPPLQSSPPPPPQSPPPPPPPQFRRRSFSHFREARGSSLLDPRRSMSSLETRTAPVPPFPQFTMHGGLSETAPTHGGVWIPPVPSSEPPVDTQHMEIEIGETSAAPFEIEQVDAEEEAYQPQTHALEGVQTHQDPEVEITNTLPGFVLFLHVLIATVIGLLIGYETTVYGGVSDSVAFLYEYFPLLRIKQMQFERKFICNFYSYSTQILNGIFHIAILFTITVVEIVSKLKKNGNFLILLSVGFIIHGIGGVTCALAPEFEMLLIGRALKGVGIGVLLETIPIILDRMESYNYKTVTEDFHTSGLVVGPVIATTLNFVMVQMAVSTPWKPAFWAPSLLSFSSLLLIWILHKGGVARDWTYRPFSCPMSSFPQLFIETVRTIATPVQDLNLYSYVIVMLFTPSKKVTYAAPLAIGCLQTVAVAFSWRVIKRCGKRTQAVASLVMAAMQGVSGIVLIRMRNIQSNYPDAVGISVLFLQGCFIAGNAIVSSPAGWVQFPFDDEVKELSRLMPIFSMCVQGVVAIFLPHIVCQLGGMIFLIWFASALILAGFIEYFVPETRDVTSREMQRARFSSHWFWRHFF